MFELISSHSSSKRKVHSWQWLAAIREPQPTKWHYEIFHWRHTHPIARHHAFVSDPPLAEILYSHPIMMNSMHSCSQCGVMCMCICGNWYKLVLNLKLNCPGVQHVPSSGMLLMCAWLLYTIASIHAMHVTTAICVLIVCIIILTHTESDSVFTEKNHLSKIWCQRPHIYLWRRYSWCLLWQCATS